MSDPYVFGTYRPRCHCGHPWCRYCYPDDPALASAAADMRAAERGDHARRMESAAALCRAYMGHGDQLSALEAEAAMFARPTLPGSNLRHRRLWRRARYALSRLGLQTPSQP